MKKKLSKKKLIQELKKLQKLRNMKVAHLKADTLLLDYIDNIEVTDAFDDIQKNYL